MHAVSTGKICSLYLDARWTQYHFLIHVEELQEFFKLFFDAPSQKEWLIP